MGTDLSFFFGLFWSTNLFLCFQALIARKVHDLANFFTFSFRLWSSILFLTGLVKATICTRLLSIPST